MNFIRFDGWLPGAHKPPPSMMKVGQTITRRNPCFHTKARMVKDMREATAKGMEFSVACEGGTFAIRRDK